MLHDTKLKKSFFGNVNKLIYIKNPFNNCTFTFFYINNLNYIRQALASTRTNQLFYINFHWESPLPLDCAFALLGSVWGTERLRRVKCAGGRDV